MIKKLLTIFTSIIFSFQICQSQTLKLKKRNADAIGGKAFALSISDSTLSLKDREKIIYREIKNGNVPDFLRKLSALIITYGHHDDKIGLYILPDYFAIGSNEDFFYVPVTPMLAQKIANLTDCILPTRSMVDLIYNAAEIKLYPQPILPSKAMTTVPVFLAHTDSILKQLQPFLAKHDSGALTSGIKKDIIISNKIYGEATPRVVIYGWHKSTGNPIQPLYNKHTNTWADYSHGVRLIQNKVFYNNKATTIKKILSDKRGDAGLLFVLSQEEGIIKKPYYTVRASY